MAAWRLCRVAAAVLRLAELLLLLLLLLSCCKFCRAQTEPCNNSSWQWRSLPLTPFLLLPLSLSWQRIKSCLIDAHCTALCTAATLCRCCQGCLQHFSNAYYYCKVWGGGEVKRWGENELETVSKVCLRSANVVNFAGVCCGYVRSRETLGEGGGEVGGEGGGVTFVAGARSQINWIDFCVLHSFEHLLRASIEGF